jgi:hypothetical protein
MRMAHWCCLAVLASWDPVLDPTVIGYLLYYGLESGHYTTELDVGDATSATIDGLLEGQTYYFAVTAYTHEGLESEFSEEVAFTVPSPETPVPEMVVRIRSPRDRAFVSPSRYIQVTAEVQAEISIAHVEIFIDDQLLCTEFLIPYRCKWLVPAALHTTYTLHAVAYDEFGHGTASPTRTVRVR